MVVRDLPHGKEGQEITINPHPEEDRRSVSKDEGNARASSFETRLRRSSG
jgi:hypothetical protein